MESRPTTCSPLLTGTKLPPTQTIPPTSLSGEATPAPAKKSNRCPTCQKRLALTDLACRCGPRFCSAHRLPEAHTCSHDFRADAQKVLAAQLVNCTAEKVQKI